ncbi:uncharacterized protein A4U43_C09F7680 [Asparagus officinalis]|uniref:Uncharacterized protein n=1 Tax=Asparagus officinalis TaxID=4686 RepID=A0A5P1E668_ASPOF|nr:uncharacterized protein A4U43_C09F7680 [Asparagus officinalis]
MAPGLAHGGGRDSTERSAAARRRDQQLLSSEISSSTARVMAELGLQYNGVGTAVHLLALQWHLKTLTSLSPSSRTSLRLLRIRSLGLSTYPFFVFYSSIPAGFYVPLSFG